MKGNMKKRDAGSLTGLLQDDGDNQNSTLVPGTPITHRRLGFDEDEGSDTGTYTGGDVGGSTRAAKDSGKAGTPNLERLLQLKGTSDSAINSCFGDVYMLDSTAFFSMKWEQTRHRSFLPGL